MTTDITKRINVSREVLGHPMQMHPETYDELPVQEGTHYEVLAYTDWADLFYPTVVQWKIGEAKEVIDDFTDLEQSQKYQACAVWAEERRERREHREHERNREEGQ